MNCKQCNRENSAAAKFCRFCGLKFEMRITQAAVSSRFCSTCGEPCEGLTPYCMKCGSPVDLAQSTFQNSQGFDLTGKTPSMSYISGAIGLLLLGVTGFMGMWGVDNPSVAPWIVLDWLSAFAFALFAIAIGIAIPVWKRRIGAASVILLTVGMAIVAASFLYRAAIESDTSSLSYYFYWGSAIPGYVLTGIGVFVAMGSRKLQKNQI